MADKKISELEEASFVSANTLIPVVVSVGGTKITKTISVQNLLAGLSANAYFLGTMTANDDVLFNGENVISNAELNQLNGQTRIAELYVANTHLQLANTFTPADASMEAPLNTGVHIFVDADYLYVSVNGTAKRVQLEEF